MSVAVFLFYLLFWIVIVGILIYLVIRRIDEKSKETFEDRDN